LVGFQAILLLLLEIQKYKVAHILDYLPYLNIAVTPNCNSGHVSGNSMGHFQVVI
jgi:hypothetical protein